MTLLNPNPFANALNNSSSCYKNFITHTHDAKSLKVPDASPFDFSKVQEYAQSSRKLTVPDTANDISFTGSFTGFIGNTSLFACHDGSVIDFNTGKIVSRAAVQKNLIQPSNQQLTQQQSDEYWKNANDQTNSMIHQMSDEQKQMLADLESGKIMKLSRLEDDNN